MKLYQKHKDKFIEYVDHLQKHGVRLSDSRFDMICLKWGVNAYIAENGVWFDADLDPALAQAKTTLYSLRKSNCFETILYKKVEELFSNNRKDYALVELYDGLQKEIIKRNFVDCNRFLQLYLTKEFRTDEVIHILNVVSPHKEKLTTWPEFLKRSTEFFVENYGEEESKILLKVVL